MLVVCMGHIIEPLFGVSSRVCYHRWAILSSTTLYFCKMPRGARKNVRLLVLNILTLYRLSNCLHYHSGYPLVCIVWCYFARRDDKALHNVCPLDPTTTVAQRDKCLPHKAPKLTITPSGWSLDSSRAMRRLRPTSAK